MNCTISVGDGLGFSREERDAADDHSRSAIGALEGVGIEEGLLHGVELAIFFQAFDGGDWLHYFAEEDLAGAAGEPPSGPCTAACPSPQPCFRAGETEPSAEQLGRRVSGSEWTGYFWPLISSSIGGAIVPRGGLVS